MSATTTTVPANDAPRFSPREMAWRLFAAELGDVRHEFQDEGERSPNYVVTPLGAAVNRVFVVGVLTTVENVGDNLDAWRAQVVDPTGVFHVYAGSYQPEAAQALSEIEAPAIVAVVGKARTYRPEEGVVYTSLRPEIIVPVDAAQRDRWILETAQQTLDRVDAVTRAMELGDPTPEEMTAAGVPSNLARGIRILLDAGERPDTARFRSLVRDAVGYLIPGAAPPGISAGNADVSDHAESLATMTPAPLEGVSAPTNPGDQVGLDEVDDLQAHAAGAPDHATATDGTPDLGEAILTWVEDLDQGDGTPWDDLVAAASALGLDEAQLEEAVNDLMDKGRLYEPVLGRLKHA